MESANKSLEEKLKEGLVAKRAEKNYQMMQEPKYQRHAKECLLGIVRSVGVGLGHGKRAGKADSMEEGICSLLYGMMFNNPETLRNIALDAARQHYFSRDEIKAHLDGLYAQAEQNGISPKVVEALRKEGERKVFPVIDTRARVFAYLVEMAQARGLQYALTDEAEDAATRVVFPTQKQYLAYQESARQKMKDYFGRVQALMLKNKRLGKRMAGMAGGVKDAIGKFSDDLAAQSVMRDVDRIYGRTPKRKKRIY